MNKVWIVTEYYTSDCGTSLIKGCQKVFANEKSAMLWVDTLPSNKVRYDVICYDVHDLL